MRIPLNLLFTFVYSTSKIKYHISTMKKFNFSIVIFILLISGISNAQNTPPLWNSILQETGDNSDRFNKIIPDGSGNFIGIGYTVRPANYRDFLTVKFDSNGDTLWWKTKNGKGNGDDEAISAGIDASGNVYVAGYSDEDVSQNDIRIIKYDPSGTVLWDTLWDSPASLDDIPVDLKIDKDGNFIIGGVVKPDTATGSKDFITLKYDPNGSLLWSQQYSNPFALKGKDDMSALALDSVSNVYVTGRSFNGSNDDFITIKYNGDPGTQSWLRTYDAGGDDRSVAIAVDHAGNILITGESDNGNNFDYRTIKYDSAGSFIWTKNYNAPSNQDDLPSALTIDENDNVFVTGVNDVDLGPTINYDFQTVKYSSAGNPLWAIRTGNAVPQNDFPNSIVVDGSGNVFVTGKSDQNIAPVQSDNDVMTVKYNSSGNIQWSGPVYYAGSRLSSDDFGYSIFSDGANIYVAGGAVNNITQRDATVIKYDATTGNQVWVKNYNGEGDFNESVKAITVDANNNSYAVGYSFEENNNLNAILTKIDQNGSVACTYQFKGIKGDDDEFNAIGIGPNGNIYAAGYTKVSGEKSNILLVKWSPSTCDTIWTRTYDFIKQSDKAQSIVLDAAGNIYLTGRSDQNPVDTSDNNDIITMKFDTNGNVLWATRYNGFANMRDEPTKIILDNDGYVIVAGRSENIHDDDFIILKYNPSDGSLNWNSPVFWASQYTNDDKVNDVIVDEFNNIYICGFAQQGSGNSAQDAILIKYDSAGNYITASFIIGDDKDEAVKIGVDISNNVYVLYKSDFDFDPLFNNYDFRLVKLTSQLDTIIFDTHYDSPINKDDVPSDLIITPSGDIYITGSSENDTSAGRVNKNWVTIGYNPAGAQIFISNYDGPNATDDSPNAMTFRGNSLWVCGNSEGAGNNQKDITVNKYNLVVGINELNATATSLVYPNPFQTETQLTLLNFDFKSNNFIEIYDMLGNLVSSPQQMHGKSIRIQRGNLSPGIYQYIVKSKSLIVTHGKLVID